MNNFDLKKYLIENKVTKNSRLVENGIELSDPELAIRWWGRKNEEEKQDLLDEYLPDFKIDEMNRRDIFWLWKKQQKL
jgi:hypothetical protein